jgi:hypothetical protein
MVVNPVIRFRTLPVIFELARPMIRRKNPVA